MRAGEEDEIRFDWRRGGAAAAGLVAALILVAMVFMVKFANDARERALAAERHAYDVALVVRNVSSNISRAEAALARFVLDEDVKTSGNIYSSDWRLAPSRSTSSAIWSEPTPRSCGASPSSGICTNVAAMSLRLPPAPLWRSRATPESAISTRPRPRVRASNSTISSRKSSAPSASRCTSGSSKARFSPRKPIS